MINLNFCHLGYGHGHGHYGGKQTLINNINTNSIFDYASSLNHDHWYPRVSISQSTISNE